MLSFLIDGVTEVEVTDPVRTDNGSFNRTITVTSGNKTYRINLEATRALNLELMHNVDTRKANPAPPPPPDRRVTWPPLLEH